MPQGVYNAAAVRSMFLAGTSRRFDIITFTDSNGIFGGSYGHYYGGQKALHDQYGQLYATGVLPVDGTGSWATQINAIDPGGVAEPGSALPAFLDAYTLDSGLGIADWSDTPYLYLADGDSIASGTVYNVNAIRHDTDTNGLWGLTDTTHPHMKWHMLMGTFASGSGKSRPGARRWNSLTYHGQEPSDIDPNTGSDGVSDYELDIPAASRTSSNGLQLMLHRVTQDSLEGPFYAAHQRIEMADRTYGPSYHIGMYQGGLSAYDACRACKATAQTAIAEYLRQCVRLQVGDPMLVVQIIHGGNDRNQSAGSWNSATEAFDSDASYTAAGFANNLDGIRKYIRDAWTSLGYAASGLAFLAGPYHVQAGDQTINSVTKSKVDWLDEFYDAVIARGWTDTTVVKGNELTTVTEMAANSEYDGGGDAHLTQAGYENHAERWVQPLYQQANDMILYHWTLDSDGTDSQGNYDINPFGSPTYAAGKIGNAASVDVETYFTNNVGVPAALNTPPLTWSAWLNPSSITGTIACLARVSTGSGGGGAHYQVVIDSSRKLVLRWRNAADSVTHTATSAALIPVGEWTHLAVTVAVSGSDVTVKLYIGGSLDTTEAQADGWYAGSPNLLRFGQLNSSHYIDGAIDDFRFYDSVLSDADVAAAVAAADDAPQGQVFGGSFTGAFTGTFTSFEARP